MMWRRQRREAAGGLKGEERRIYIDIYSTEGPDILIILVESADV